MIQCRVRKQVKGDWDADDADPKGTRIFTDLFKSAEIRAAEHPRHLRSIQDVVAKSIRTYEL